MGKVRKSKNQLRREKIKQRKLEIGDLKNESLKINDKNLININHDDKARYDDQVLDIDFTNNPILEEEFRKVFEKFKLPDTEAQNIIQQENGKADIFYSDDEKSVNGNIESSDEENDNQKNDNLKPLSKRQRRIKNKIPLAVLKSQTKRPEVVEWNDVDATDPKLLIYLKSLKNIIPVPSHWSSKREYLSSKRGMERPPFNLPDFIQNTGIAEMRDTTNISEENLKKISRERVQPKLNKLDLDYKLLYDAFFNRQTKPKLLGYGDVYYEGRELLANDELLNKIDSFRPGKISKTLSNALGIPYGAPPPWIIMMSQIGLPPSYPYLKVPGFNVPIDNATNTESTNDIDRSHWGALEAEDEEEEDENEEEDNEEEDEEDEDQNIEYEQENPDEKQDEIKPIPITSLDNNATAGTINKPQAREKDDRPLYQILQQTGEDTNTRYNLPTNTEETKEDDEGSKKKRKIELQTDDQGDGTASWKKFRF